jgi:uncharacterized protein YoxC
MDMTTIIRIVAGVLAVAVLAIVIYRRKNRANLEPALSARSQTVGRVTS